MMRKGVEDYKRDFQCQAFAIGYFRVPAFREVFIKQINYKSE